MKKVFLAAAVISTTNMCSAEASEQPKNNRFEFYVGINSGVNTSWYDIDKKDAKLAIKIGADEHDAWNATGIHKTKYLPFIEAELLAEYLMNRVFIGARIAGGGSIGGKYTEKGYKGLECDDAATKDLANSCFQRETLKIAKTKYHVSVMPYVGFRMNDNSDVYLTGGLKMVASQLFNKTKRTVHPVMGFGGRYMIGNWVLKVEYNFVFPKKKQISGKMNITTGGAPAGTANYKIKVKHAESVLKIGVGYKFC